MVVVALRVPNDTHEQMQGPVQCVDNPMGYGVKVYADKTFYHTPLPRAPAECMGSPEGPVMIYYDKSFHRGPESQEYKEDELSAASGTVPFPEPNHTREDIHPESLSDASQ